MDRAGFSVSEVLQGYRLRWQIELLFKEVKSYGGWHRFTTRSVTLVFSRILLSFVVATLKQYSAHAALSDMDAEISTQKVAKSGTHLFGDMLAALMNNVESMHFCLEKLIIFRKSNSSRERLVRNNGSERSRD